MTTQDPPRDESPAALESGSMTEVGADHDVEQSVDSKPRDNDAPAAATEKQAPASAPAGPPGPPGPPGPAPPDGGLLAWMQVAASFGIFFNTWGMLNTFGIFQTYYETGALFHESSSNISWIGSIQAYCVLIGGLFSGPVYDKGYLRALLVSGSFFTVFGFMMLSICKTFWQAVLAQGFCVGIGAGLLFTPSLALIPTYFRRRLGLAVGLAASGSSLGGVIYPIVFYKLIDQIGFGWTVRTIAFIALGTLLPCVLFAKQRVVPAKSRAMFDPTALKDLPYLLFTVSVMVGFIGLYVVIFYISFFGAAGHIVSDKMAFYLVPILNAGSVLGRTLPNAISDKTGPFNIFGGAAIICSILTYSMMAVNNTGGLVVMALLYGFFSGVFIALPGVCFVQLTADKSKIGTRIGMGFAFIGFAVLAGGPGGGNVLGSNNADLHWHKLWIYGGTTMLACGIMQIGLRFWLAKGKLLVKV